MWGAGLNEKDKSLGDGEKWKDLLSRWGDIQNFLWNSATYPQILFRVLPDLFKRTHISKQSPVFWGMWMYCSPIC